MKFDFLPDAEEAKQLLHELAVRNPAIGPRQVNKPVALYGAGNLGQMARDYFAHLGISIELVVDKSADRYKNDRTWAGITLKTPAEVLETEKQTHMLVVAIANFPYADIAAELGGHGWHDVVPFYDVSEAYRDKHPLSNGWFVGQLNQAEQQAIGDVLAGWHDDVSRAHHVQFIAWHALREDWLFAKAPVTIDDRYFIPEIRAVMRADERFADVGAHYGEVVQRLTGEVVDSFDVIWAIEADALNFREMAKNLAAFPPEKVRLMQLALGDETGRQPFFGGLGYASQLVNDAGKEVEVVTLDSLQLTPTFIKLHLEGSELDVLKGAEHTLQSCRPVITATAYHNRLGLSAFPQWLMAHLRDYRFLFRLHSWCGTGGVIYAIPQERFGR